MAIVTALAVSLIASIIAVELYFAFPKASDWLLRIATRRLSGPIKERCFEEWKAQLADIHSPLLRMLHAMSLIYHAKTVLQEDIDGYFSELDADIAAIKAQREKTLAEGRKNIGIAVANCARFRRKFGIVGLAILIATIKSARRWTKPIVLTMALKRISPKITPMLRSLVVFEKAMVDALRLVQMREAKVALVIAQVRADKQKAAAKLARSGNYQTETPLVAADLRARLSKSVAEIRAPNAATAQVIKNVQDAVKTMQERRRPEKG